jgi:NAD(P)-dependent dehydrogenase (short-subunit alcohol dehydrogenase family)
VTWTEAEIPDQRGRTAVVTGANSGLGLIVARELAAAGARVVLACRNVQKGEEAIARIEDAVPGVDLDLRELDLASLDSVRRFAASLTKEHPRLEVLVNNAGVMASPRRHTVDGFELQLGTNHLGHFALTGLLLEALQNGNAEARVVTVSSIAHYGAHIAWDNLMGERRYFRWAAYGQSKLANLLFAFELDRRLAAAGSGLRSVAAHPGYAATNLQFASPPIADRLVMRVTNLFAQSDERGALPLLYAATCPGLPGGVFIGPDGVGGVRGSPQPVGHWRAAGDPRAAARLWEISEQLTGVHFPFAPAATR